MLDFHVKIGLVPLRKDTNLMTEGLFNAKSAFEVKEKVVPYIQNHFSNEHISFVDLEELNDEGLLYLYEQADKAAAILKKENVDAILLINANFGNEEAAGRLAKLMQLPTAIWAPRDNYFDPADGQRKTDSQCGLFAVSRILQRNHIPFTHIENADADQDVFKREFLRFAAAVCMAKNFTNMRVLTIGSRPRLFTSVMVNEYELLEKFGIELVPVNNAVFQQKYDRLLTEKQDAIQNDLQTVKARFTPHERVTDELLTKSIALKYVYKELCEEYNCNVMSSECWSSMRITTSVMPCFAMSMLFDEGIIVSCEADILGAITMALLQCATMGKKVPFFGEFTCRHPQKDDAELIWHCGTFAYSLKKEGYKARYNINPAGNTVRPSYPIKDATYTIARLDSESGKYSMLAGTFTATEGPDTLGTHVWAKFDDLAKWEKTVIYGPYIHHMAEIEGDVVDVLREFVKFVPGDITIVTP